MSQIIRIGMDTSKHIFQLHGVDAAEQPVLRQLGFVALVAADGGAVLLLDAGDTYQGGIESDISEGALVIDAFLGSVDGEIAIRVTAGQDDAETPADLGRRVAEAVASPGGRDAMQLRVAENYVQQFGRLAQAGNTLVVPANLTDIAGMVALATARTAE